MASHRLPIQDAVTLMTYGAGTIKKPVAIASFSVTDDGCVHPNDDRALKLYIPPNLPISLGKGFDTCQPDTTIRDPHMDNFLTTVKHYEGSSARRLEADFVVWRGCMTKIMTTPYQRQDPWALRATKFQGTIFIELDHEFKLEHGASMERGRRAHNAPARGSGREGAPSQELSSYFGRKFEKICTVDRSVDVTAADYVDRRDEEEVTGTYSEWCTVVETSFADRHKVVLAGEVDAAEGGAQDKLVELKTSKDWQSAADRRIFQRKLCKFWAQSFLAGVRFVVVGFRTNDQQGRVVAVHHMRTTSLPDHARTLITDSPDQQWDTRVCINFTAQVLDFVKQHVVDGGVWEIRFMGKRHDAVTVTRHPTHSYSDILSQDFIQWRA